MSNKRNALHILDKFLYLFLNFDFWIIGQTRTKYYEFCLLLQYIIRIKYKHIIIIIFF